MARNLEFRMMLSTVTWRGSARLELILKGQVLSIFPLELVEGCALGQHLPLPLWSLCRLTSSIT